jgi:hypothetical protein
VTDVRHQRVALLLSEYGPLAPPALRLRIAAEAADRAPRQRWQPPQLARFALGATVAAVALALVLPLAFKSDGDPTVLDTHALSSGGPRSSAPPALAHQPRLLAADLDGVRFPDWEREFGWKAYGQRHDELDGRQAKTVFYEHEGHQIAYTIIAGEPLPPPSGATHRRVDGVDLAIYHADDGHEIVTFQRQGKTCVLSGHVEHRSTLVELATWRGDGRLTF